MKEDTYNFEYWPGTKKNSCVAQVRLSFDTDSALHCADFHSMCRKFAIAVGYTPQTVDEIFGPEIDTDR